MFGLSELRVEGFRSIKEEEFQLNPLTILIGQNNAGKTNVLDAIAMLLEGSNRDVTKEDFFGSSGDFQIQGKFHNANSVLDLLESSQKTKVSNCIDGEGCITVRRIGKRESATLDKIEIYDPSTSEFGTPTGIDAALKRILPDPIRIRPLSDVSDELSGRTTSALTRLLAQITGTLEEQAQPLLEKAYGEANLLLNVLTVDGEEKDERVDALKQIEANVTVCLQEAFPSTRTRISMGMPTVKQILGNVQILVNDGNLWKPYFRHGHGLQRALCLSLLRTLAQYLRESVENPLKRPFMLLLAGC